MSSGRGNQRRSSTNSSELGLPPSKTNRIFDGRGVASCRCANTARNAFFAIKSARLRDRTMVNSASARRVFSRPGVTTSGE